MRQNKFQSGDMKTGMIFCVSVMLWVFTLNAFSGCAAPAIIAIGAAGYQAPKHLSSGTVEETVDFEISAVKKAVLMALHAEKAHVEETRASEGGEEIQARAADINIIIKLERIDSGRTRLEITAKSEEGGTEKEKAGEIMSRVVQKAEKVKRQDYSTRI